MPTRGAVGEAKSTRLLDLFLRNLRLGHLWVEGLHSLARGLGCSAAFHGKLLALRLLVLKNGGYVSAHMYPIRRLAHHQTYRQETTTRVMSS